MRKAYPNRRRHLPHDPYFGPRRLHYTPRVLSIHLFGAPRIILGGQSLTVARRKSRSLIHYLASHRQPQPSTKRFSPVLQFVQLIYRQADIAQERR